MIAYKTRLCRNRGVAAVEFALVLPFLLLMSLAVVDFSRFIQAQLIITNVSREGANMSSRFTPVGDAENVAKGFQAILDGLAASMPPLKMSDFGMIYITEVTALANNNNNAVTNTVTNQFYWLKGWSGSPNSAIWSCGQWKADGSCDMGTSTPTANLMAGELNAGDQIYAVEVFYNLPSLFGGLQITTNIRVPNIGPILRSMNVM
ncbi:hypothetical protein GCM10027046_06130 [Uliginosibacterium flavum]|uniref:TadE family protein n=1 Tax=Uliginosibacterium flavum TaxID=1396831 RepID=A0ABV2TIS6_9RHOO